MEKSNEVINSISNNSSMLDLANEVIEKNYKSIIQKPIMQKKYEILKIVNKTNNLLEPFNNNKTLVLDLKSTNITDSFTFIPQTPIPSIFLTFINFINNNKIKLSIVSFILILFIIACFNSDFLNIIQNFISNNEYEIGEEIEKNSNIEELVEDLNKPVQGKPQIFTENLIDREFVTNNTLSPSTQNYLKSLYSSLEKLKEKENQLLILQEYNSRREISSEEEKIEFRVHNKRFANQLKIVKSNRYYFNKQIQLILNSQNDQE